MNEENSGSIQFDSSPNAKAETDARLAMLYEVGRVLASSETMRAASPLLLEAICRHLEFDLGEYWRLDERETNLTLESAWSPSAASLGKFVAASRAFAFPPGEGLPGKVWQRNRAAWIEDLSLTNETPRRLLAVETGLRSEIALPILLGERFLGALCFFSVRRRASEPAWLETLAAVASHVGQFIERARAETTSRASDDRYRAFIRQSTEGIWRFELDEKISVELPIEEQVELAFERGYLAECNDAMARMYGLERATDLIGSRVKDLLDPADAANYRYIRSFAESDYNLVDAETREKDANGSDRYFLNSLVGTIEDGFLIRVWGTQRDITEIKRAENRLALLAAISELTRTADAPEDLLFAVSKAVGEHLEVRRCLFNEIDLARDCETVQRDYCRGVRSVAGVSRISDYSAVTVADMTGGRTVVNHDSKLDARTAEVYEQTYAPHGERAYVAVPLLRENRWVASLWVSTDTPRDWSGQEIALLETVAERTWTAVEKLRINRALGESEQRLRLAVDISRFSTFDINLTTDRVETDEIGREIYGFAADEPLTFAKIQARFHPADKEDVLRRVALTFDPASEADEFETEQRIIRTNGETRWIRVRGRTFFAGEAAARRAVRCLGTYIDITASKRAEAALRASEERYRSLFETMDEGFCVCEMIFDAAGAPLDYRFLETNPAFERMTGLQDADGRTARELIPNLEPRWFEIYGNVVKSGDAIRFVDGSDAMRRWFDVYASRVGTADERRFALLFTDITERRRNETERERLLVREQKAREIAEEANHAKDEFIALVSHELRSPLNAMLGWTRILQQQNPDAKTIAHALDVIVRNARSQSRLIEDLLDIARVGRGKLRLELEPTELVPIIETAIEIIAPTAEAGNVRLDQKLDRAATFVTGDADRLRQIVENLLANAVKFTPPGGSVEIRLEPDDKSAVITVRDTGQGISPGFLPQIFERFKQADPSTTRRHGGLGIGLSLARDLVELHGGTIAAASQGEGKGATFTVRLPSRVIPPLAENSDKVEIMNGKLSGFWILAVDDEADARELVSFMLQINGAKVTTANSAVEALEILKSSAGRLPDILLSDISMPNESGYALLEKIRALPEEHGGQIPAVALTAFSRPEDREAAYEAGFQKHLGKPVEPDVLIAAIIETASAKQV